jgi:hypothetical protein
MFHYPTSRAAQRMNVMQPCARHKEISFAVSTVPPAQAGAGAGACAGRRSITSPASF